MTDVDEELAARDAHELKTPVASMLALSGVIRAAAENDPAAVSHFLPRPEREAQRLAALVTDLPELSRLEVGTPARAEVRLEQRRRHRTDIHRTFSAADPPLP